MTCHKCHCRMKYFSDPDTGELECAWWSCDNCGQCYQESSQPQVSEPEQEEPV